MNSETPVVPISHMAMAIAVLVAVVFLAMSSWLTYKFPEWQQVAVVYNAVCAVAFSAFGVLLGSKVQEVNVTRAIQTAQAATIDASKKTVAIKAAIGTLHGSAATDNEAGGGVGSVLQAQRSALGILIEAMN